MAVFSKRSLEGYAQIDHRDSPGISAEFVHKHKLDAPAVPAGVHYESAFVVCHCCQNDILLHPDRSRERGYCRKHDAYLCDNCATAQKAGADCIPFSQRFEQWFEMACKGLPLPIV